MVNGTRTPPLASDNNSNPGQITRFLAFAIET